MRGVDALCLDLIGCVACGALHIGDLAEAGVVHLAYIGNAGTADLIGSDILGGNLVGPVELAEGHLVHPVFYRVVKGSGALGDLADLVVALPELGGAGFGVANILIGRCGVGAVFEPLGDVASAFEGLVAEAACGIDNGVRLILGD